MGTLGDMVLPRGNRAAKGLHAVKDTVSPQSADPVSVPQPALETGGLGEVAAVCARGQGQGGL